MQELDQSLRLRADELRGARHDLAIEHRLGGRVELDAPEAVVRICTKAGAQVAHSGTARLDQLLELLVAHRTLREADEVAQRLENDSAFRPMTEDADRLLRRREPIDELTD